MRRINAILLMLIIGSIHRFRTPGHVLRAPELREISGALENRTPPFPRRAQRQTVYAGTRVLVWHEVPTPQPPTVGSQKATWPKPAQDVLQVTF